MIVNRDGKGDLGLVLTHHVFIQTFFDLGGVGKVLGLEFVLFRLFGLLLGFAQVFLYQLAAQGHAVVADINAARAGNEQACLLLGAGAEGTSGRDFRCCHTVS